MDAVRGSNLDNHLLSPCIGVDRRMKKEKKKKTNLYLGHSFVNPSKYGSMWAYTFTYASIEVKPEARPTAAVVPNLQVMTDLITVAIMVKTLVDACRRRKKISRNIPRWQEGKTFRMLKVLMEDSLKHFLAVVKKMLTASQGLIFAVRAVIPSITHLVFWNTHRRQATFELVFRTWH